MHASRCINAFHLTGFEVGRVSRESDSEDKSGQAPTGHGTHCGGTKELRTMEGSLTTEYRSDRSSTKRTWKITENIKILRCEDISIY